MKHCDLCKEEVDKLVELKREFCTYKVKEVCRPCMKELEAFNSRINATLMKIGYQEKKRWFENFIRNFKK